MGRQISELELGTTLDQPEDIKRLSETDASADLTFDQDLYRGTARYYDRYRVSYPRELLDNLLRSVQPSGHGLLLDLACGTGQITFALSDRFAEVWAVDQEPGMVELVREKALTRANRVRAVVSSAEGLDAPPAAFELVAIGNAFHRLRRDEVAANAFRWLQPGGCIALLWSTGPSQGKEEWQQQLASFFAHWQEKIGVESRVPANWQEPRRQRPDDVVLTAAGFQLIGPGQYALDHEWDVETLIGWVYSSSFLPKAALGARAHEFEAELRREFGALAASNKLRERIDFLYQLACRPA